jgi:hypothetical protein
MAVNWVLGVVALLFVRVWVAGIAALPAPVPISLGPFP